MAYGIVTRSINSDVLSSNQAGDILVANFLRGFLQKDDGTTRSESNGKLLNVIMPRKITNSVKSWG